MKRVCLRKVRSFSSQITERSSPNGVSGVIRGYKIKTGTGYIIEWPLQLVCDLEISGSTDEPVIKDKVDNSGDADTRERPSRKAKAAAIDKMVGVTLNEQEED
jgi:hypothetical protein